MSPSKSSFDIDCNYIPGTRQWDGKMYSRHFDRNSELMDYENCWRIIVNRVLRSGVCMSLPWSLSFPRDWQICGDFKGTSVPLPALILMGSASLTTEAAGCTDSKSVPARRIKNHGRNFIPFYNCWFCSDQGKAANCTVGDASCVGRFYRLHSLHSLNTTANEITGSAKLQRNLSIASDSHNHDYSVTIQRQQQSFRIRWP